MYFCRISKNTFYIHTIPPFIIRMQNVHKSEAEFVKIKVINNMPSGCLQYFVKRFFE